MDLDQHKTTTGTTREKNKYSFTIELSPSSTEKQNIWCYIRFVSKADLVASGCLKDDCLVIKCTVDVSRLINDAGEEEHDIGSIVVPPSNVSQDLQSLLGSGQKEDLTLKVGGLRIFKAHACLLRARSPLFHAKLCDSVNDVGPFVWWSIQCIIEFKSFQIKFMQCFIGKCHNFKRDILI